MAHAGWLLGAACDGITYVCEALGFLLNSRKEKMEKKNKDTKARTFVYEYEPADNGAILAEPSLRMVQVCKGDDEAKMIGEYLYDDLRAYISDNNCEAVRITVKVEEIEAKY